MPTLFDLLANEEENKSPDKKAKPVLKKDKSAEDNKTIVERKLLKRFWDSDIPLDKKKVKDMVKAAAKQAGVSPEFFYASAYQEGLPNIKYIGTIEDGDAAFDENTSDEFPVNGFFHYGLDTFGDKAEYLRTKGYLPENFEYKPFVATNEKGMRVNSASFRNNQDALFAKAAMMRDLVEQSKDYAARKGLKLNDSDAYYLAMSGFNGGWGRSMEMIDDMKTRGIQPADYVSKGMTRLKGVHSNIEPRMRFAKIMKPLIDEENEKAAILVDDVKPLPGPFVGGTLDMINRGGK